jgi:hypothetical protein
MEIMRSNSQAWATSHIGPYAADTPGMTGLGVERHGPSGQLRALTIVTHQDPWLACFVMAGMGARPSDECRTTCFASMIISRGRKMTKYWKSAVCGLGLLILGSPGFADEIAPKDLVGMWSLVSWEEVFPDGHKIVPLGDNGKGMLVFDQAGHFVISLISLLPKYAVNDRAAGSPEDNKRLAEGVLTYFGTYSVEVNTLVYHIDRSSFPNLPPCQ